VSTAQPISPGRLGPLLAELAAGRQPGHPLRVAVDGPPAARPEALADAVADSVRLLGRPALRVGARWFLRPA
jgi:hypothetical protein